MENNKKKAKGAYHPKGPANQGPQVEETTYSKTEVYASRRPERSRRPSSNSGIPRSLDFLAMDKSIAAKTAKPTGVQDWGCWWKMGDYLFQRIEAGGNKDAGFEPGEVPIICEQVSNTGWWGRVEGRHLLVKLPKNPTYVQVDEKTIRIPYTKRVVQGKDDYSYRRTLESSEILHFNP